MAASDLSVFDTLLGKGTQPGLIGQLGAVGDKLNTTTSSWAGLIGPYLAKSAPGPVPAPPVSNDTTVAPVAGFMGLPFSLSTAAAGAAAVALLVYLVIRGR